MVAYFCHHLLDNYVDMSDLYDVLSVITSSTTPWVVTLPSPVGDSSPAGPGTGVPARPRSPSPAPDHPGGQTGLGKSYTLLVETNLAKKGKYINS